MVSLTISCPSQNPLGPRLDSHDIAPKFNIRCRSSTVDMRKARLSKVQLTWIQVANNKIHFIYTLLGKVLFVTLRVCGQDTRVYLRMQGLDSPF